MLTLLRYWHTLKYLQWGQIWGRFKFRFYRPALDYSPPPKTRQGTDCLPWVFCHKAASMLSPSEFKLLNSTISLKTADSWNDQELSYLLRYNLHYFDDLTAVNSESRVDWHRALINRWISENLTSDGVGWEPYPTSLRIVNWIKWAFSGNSLDDNQLHSLAMQTRHLSKRLEYHLGGNHLWTNGKALLFAACFFEGEEAAFWAMKGNQILEQEIEQQILSDGGHFELSPMYHAIILEDIIDLVQLGNHNPNVIDDSLESKLSELVQSMAGWLDAMTHPDGDISYFNDATSEVSPVLSELLNFASKIGKPITLIKSDPLVELRDSGFSVLKNDTAYLIADVGRIGPDYLPGHAHADTLSFELSLFGKRVIVNSGIDRYEVSNERLQQRGTPAHNTICINNTDSSEVWSSFRVARRARPMQYCSRENKEQVEVTCAHDGYTRLSKGLVHTRKWSLGNEKLVITDHVTGDAQSSRAFLHFHPGIGLDENGDNTYKLTFDDKRIRLSFTGGYAKVMDGLFYPGFGKSEACKILCINMIDTSLISELNWAK